VSYITQATFSGREAATRPLVGPMVRIHLPLVVSPCKPAPPWWVSCQSHLRSVPVIPRAWLTLRTFLEITVAGVIIQ
jgi:hypothetical protein